MEMLPVVSLESDFQGWFIIPPMELRANPIPEKIEKEEQQTEEEPPYRVIIHNDDVTPMDFVIHILITVFLIPNTNAMNIMYTAHLNGAAYVQTLPKTEAKRRINKAHFAARLKSFPLKFTMEPE
jgi:ATP-dependent Clp protease adaptor protein ClpS